MNRNIKFIMNHRFTYLILMFVLYSCTPTPEKINYGKDSCHHCKMLVMDVKYGAEIVTSKGKVFKFDDINCMIYYLRESGLKPQEIAHLMVVDFKNPGKLINAYNSWYIYSEEIRSPMASGVAAFETNMDLNSYTESNKGTSMNWEQTYNLFK